MNRVFKPRGFFTVPDGTDVSPFLNATDVMQHDVPWDALSEMSIAAGRLDPGVASWIHMHPVVVQVTYMVSGRLTIWMKDQTTSRPYQLDLSPGEAVVTEPRTLFQLRNTSKNLAEVLYIVSPSYVFEKTDGKVVHDDAVLVARTWDELATAQYKVPALEIPKHEAVASRAESLRRLATGKGVQLMHLAEERIHSVSTTFHDPSADTTTSSGAL